MTRSPERRAGLGDKPWPATALPHGPDGVATRGARFSTQLEAQLTWDYECRNERILALYEQGKHAQWNASTDVDWSIEVDWGGPLDESSPYARTQFERSPLGRHGRDFWNRFQWEFQSWMVSQFLHGEQGALVACARLAEVMPDVEAKLFAVNQAVDEARHVEVFRRYLTEHVPEPYPVADPLQSLLLDVLPESRWDILTLGIQIVVEGVALAAFRLANSTFHDRLITSITERVIRDEARHVSFGTITLHSLYREMTEAERADRVTFVLDAADLVYRRFLLGEIWERLGIDPAEGTEFARTNSTMVAYRQTVFAKVVSALKRIDLLGPSVVAGLDELGLIGGAGRLAAGHQEP